MSKAEYHLLDEESQMDDFGAYEDSESFKRLRSVVCKFRSAGEGYGNSSMFLSLIETALNNSENGVSEAEQKETLAILRNYDPIMYDILYQMCGFDAETEYQTILKRMVVQLVGREGEVHKRYNDVMGWFSLTGVVPESSRKYTDFMVGNYYKTQRNFLIVLGVLLLASAIFLFMIQPV